MSANVLSRTLSGTAHVAMSTRKGITAKERAPTDGDAQTSPNILEKWGAKQSVGLSMALQGPWPLKSLYRYQFSLSLSLSLVG